MISDGETEPTEFKPSLSQTDRIMESVSAFSNTRGGTILIGVSDRGDIPGPDVGRSTLEDLAGYVKRNSDPPVYPSIGTVHFERKTLLFVTVKESSEKPVFFQDRLSSVLGGATRGYPRTK